MIAEVAFELARALRELKQIRGVEFDEGIKEDGKQKTVSFIVRLADGEERRLVVTEKTERKAPKVVGFAAGRPARTGSAGSAGRSGGRASTTHSG